jgi:hypothetical protein
MRPKNEFVAAVAFLALALACGLASPRSLEAQQTQNVAKHLGTIKTINGSVITLTPDSGPDITVNVQPNARILRLAPGDKDLKNATPIQLQDLQVGDTIRVRGFAADNATTMPALEVILITRSAVAAVSDQIRQDWQKRGLGGLVSSVDPATHTVTISIAGFGGTKSIAVHASDKTVFRRYAPESIKFEDAKPSTLQAIQPGDQLRARGTRSADGTEFAAEEIVTGSFRNIAGTVNSVDASAGTLSVQDLITKKAVQIKITADSQLRKLPPEVAQRIAMRLKGAMAGGGNASAGSGAGAGGGSQTAQNAPPSSSGSNSPSSNSGAAGASSGAGGPGGGMRSGGAPDFQQMLGRMPAATLADLHKGDAVLLVATEGTPNGASTAITMLSGVEPILEAAPSASQAMMLAPWSLGGAPGGDAANQ